MSGSVDFSACANSKLMRRTFRRCPASMPICGSRSTRLRSSSEALLVGSRDATPPSPSTSSTDGGYQAVPFSISAKPATFAAGHRIGAWGGRALWQLKDAQDLVIAWRPVTDGQTAKEIESSLLDAFRLQW